MSRSDLIAALRNRFIETPEYCQLKGSVQGQLHAHARSLVIVGKEQTGRGSAISRILRDESERALLAKAVLTPRQMSMKQLKENKKQLLSDLINSLNGPAALLKDTVDLPERFLRLLMTQCRKHGRNRVIIFLGGIEYATPQTFDLLEYARLLANSKDIELQFVFKLTPESLKMMSNILRNDGTQNLIAKHLAHATVYQQFSLGQLPNLLAEVEGYALPSSIDGTEEEKAPFVQALLPTWYAMNWRLCICGQQMLDAMKEVAKNENRNLANALPIPLVARMVWAFLDECSHDHRAPTHQVLVDHCRTAAKYSGLREHILQS